MAYLDYKITTWERITICDSDIETVRDLLKKDVSIEEITTTINCENIIQLSETNEIMTIEENQGNPTLELCSEITNVPLFTNTDIDGKTCIQPIIKLTKK